MKVELTKAQLEAIQKLLQAHSGAGGCIPNADVCSNAFENIEKQTGIIHVTDLDLKRNKKGMVILTHKTDSEVKYEK